MDISVQGFRMLRPLVKKSRTRVRIIRAAGDCRFFYIAAEEKMLFAGLAVRYPASEFMSCFLMADRY